MRTILWNRRKSVLWVLGFVGALFSMHAVGAVTGTGNVTVGVVMHGDVSDNRTGTLLAARLERNFQVETISYETICQQVPDVDILLVPESPLFPLHAAGTLHRFLKAGGSLVALGGDPFSRPVLRYKGRWAEIPEVDNSLFADGTSVISPLTYAVGAWKPRRSNTAAASRVVRISDSSHEAYRFEFRDNDDFDEFSLAVDPLAATDADALLFYARADGVTPQAVIRLKFEGGFVGEYVVDLTPEWRPVTIPLSRLAVGRKAAGKLPLPSTLEGLSEVTVSMTTLRHRFRDHDVEVSEIRAVRLPESYLDRIEDDGFVLCEQRDVYVYDDASSICSPEGAPQYSFNGDFRGISALGFPVHGVSRYVPLLESRDHYDRRRGWAAGVVVNEAGAWAGSNWAVFGVEDSEWYRTESFAAYLEKLLPLLQKNTAFGVSEMRIPEPVGRPLQPVVLQGDRFVREDGKPLFIVGENLGCLLYDRSLGEHDAESLDRLFWQLSAAGVNALRILNVNNIVARDNLGLLARSAERWGVYLLIGATPGGDRGHARGELDTYAGKLSRGLAASPALLGYDLRNEPYVHEVSRNKDYDGRTLARKYPYTAAGMSGLANSMLRPDSYGSATFYGCDRVVPRPEDAVQAQAYDAVNGIFGDWIGWYRSAFARLGDRHPLTVGFNLWYAALPVGGKVDFLNQHTYVMPTDFEAVHNEITTMDRLHAMYPDKPVTLGEFGYTSGYVLQGRPLSVQSQAIGEMIHLLYAWTRNYGGVFDWQVYDFDPVNYRRIAVWNRDRYRFKQDYERLHGIYAWDGTPYGMLKPYGMCMRFFSDAVAEGMDRGELEYYKAPTQIGTGFTFRASNALMVGGCAYKDKVLCFNAGRECVVCMFRAEGEIRLMSTDDTVVTLSPAAIPGFGTVREWTAANCRAGMHCEGEKLVVALLAGETVTLRPNKN